MKKPEVIIADGKEYRAHIVPSDPLPEAAIEIIAGVMDQTRDFDTGATRSSDAGRYDPEGFLSPLVLERYCEYMNKNRVLPDGSIRDSDNWQNGIPLTAYAKSAWRHFLHFWARHREVLPRDEMASADIEEDLCALLFNLSGYLHEVLLNNQPSQPIAATDSVASTPTTRIPTTVYRPHVTSSAPSDGDIGHFYKARENASCAEHKCSPVLGEECDSKSPCEGCDCSKDSCFCPGYSLVCDGE